MSTLPLGLPLPVRAGTSHSPSGQDDNDNENRILLRWLLGLRWVVFALLALTLPVGSRFFGFHVRYEIALPPLVLVAAASALLLRHARSAPRVSTRLLALGVALDLLAIGAVLAGSGGAANPFSAVFFVHVALAASLLPARTTFALSALSAGVFASLFALPGGSCCANHSPSEGFSAHLYGMWLAFVVAAGLVTYFLTRVRHALESRSREIAQLRKRAEESARFAALGTLAAGTAHELATPLGTIAVLASEIVESSGADDVARSQAGAIREQVNRCKDVIRKMAAGASENKAKLASGDLAQGICLAAEVWKKAHPEVLLEVRGPSHAEGRFGLSDEDIEAALCALLDNALFASQVQNTPICVHIEKEPEGLCVRVEDEGEGVPPELLERLGEPFLSTKEPGYGMGLGLYLVRTLMEQRGGYLEVRARHPKGTCVSLHFRELGSL